MSADIETYFDVAPQGWDELVSRLAGNVFHSTLWAEYQQKTKNLRPIYLLLRDERGNGCAGAVAFFQQSRFPLASLVVRELLLPTNPFFVHHDASLCLKMVEICERLGEKLGCSRVSINSLMSSASPFIPSNHAYTESRRLEFLLDLDRDMDKLWAGIARDQREKIKRLKRLGVTVEVGLDHADMQGLRVTREATQAKRAQHGQGYVLPDDDTFYEGIYEHLLKRGAGRLFVARHEGQVIGALFFATFNKRACSVFSGSTDAGYKLAAQSGLFWEAVNQFKADGFRELNRGGLLASSEKETDPLHGIYLFKKRLGTVPQLCRTGFKILSPWRERLTTGWKRLRALRPES